MTSPWWRDAVVYQVYVRSFADSDNDGVGDLAGLTEHLDHVVRLGVDAIWLNPIYPSPDADHGYDIADYTDVDSRYGGLAAFDLLLDQAHARGLRVLMDLVPNHCSVEHEWFRAALASPPGSPQRDRFIFRTGDGDRPPNNWRSVFGGLAWTRLPGTDQWYLHSFDSSQPDFNWRNPEVPAYFERVLRFWFDRGVDGFRIDAAHLMYKQASLPDWSFPADGSDDYNEHWQNQPEVHDVLRAWRRLADSYGRDLTLVGEIWVRTVADLARYLRPDELQQAFYFDLLMCPWNAPAFQSSVGRGLDQIAATGATITWTLANHDVHRAVTRFGLISTAHSDSANPIVNSIRARGEVDVAMGVRRARAALLLMLALPGSTYLYQGEELGLPEVLELPDTARQDPTWFRSGGTEHGRDGCRVPLPWHPAGNAFGFSSAGQPWLPQPAWFGDYAVAGQWADPGSTLCLYASALAQRKRWHGPLDWLTVPGRADVLAFRRGQDISVTVFGDRPFEVPPDWGRIVLSSTPVTGLLPGESTAWVVGG